MQSKKRFALLVLSVALMGFAVQGCRLVASSTVTSDMNLYQHGSTEAQGTVQGVFAVSRSSAWWSYIIPQPVGLRIGQESMGFTLTALGQYSLTDRWEVAVGGIGAVAPSPLAFGASDASAELRAFTKYRLTADSSAFAASVLVGGLAAWGNTGYSDVLFALNVEDRMNTRVAGGFAAVPMSVRLSSALELTFAPRVAFMEHQSQYTIKPIDGLVPIRGGFVDSLFQLRSTQVTSLWIPMLSLGLRYKDAFAPFSVHPELTVALGANVPRLSLGVALVVPLVMPSAQAPVPVLSPTEAPERRKQ
jgi:hypothetical protein